MEKLTAKKLKIIFVGIPDMALVCLENLIRSKFEIVAVVPPKKNHETFNFFKNFVQSKNIEFLEFENSPNDIEYCEKIKALNADIGVVCSYNSRFSKEFLSTTKMGYINCHPSLLPQYRGAAPYFHVVKNNEKFSGITLHFMDETFDTGDIVYQEKFEILPDETMGTLFNRTTYMLSNALVKVLGDLEKTGEIKRYPQPKGEFNLAPKVNGNFRLRWHYHASELECLIRACNPFYNAFCGFRGTTLKIIKAKIILKEHNLEFGTIASSNDKELLIAVKGGFLSPEVMSFATWGYFTPESFYNTFSPQVGEYLD
ncbi:MAG: methionyl-tRNA formyltransferase [Candidatus Gastranaerophilales bacterium]|nr:methionyl-tRNA formyltransferase [Candidatus Gastranaerophilales bacterium]